MKTFAFPAFSFALAATFLAGCATTSVSEPPVAEDVVPVTDTAGLRLSDSEENAEEA